MHCHLVVYVRIIVTTLIILTCLLGDNFVELTQHPLLKALADNATHAIIGALTGIAFAVHFYERTTNLFGWLLIFLCFVVSSLIDIDHFLEARSWSLENATIGLAGRRPFLHCSSIIIIMMIAFIQLSCFNYFRASLICGILMCAFITHHTRDAVRRGYWFCPFGHTDRLPYRLYIAGTVITPYAVFYMYAVCRSRSVQDILGQYFNINNNYRSASNYRLLEV